MEEEILKPIQEVLANIKQLKGEGPLLAAIAKIERILNPNEKKPGDEDQDMPELEALEPDQEMPGQEESSSIMMTSPSAVGNRMRRQKKKDCIANDTESVDDLGLSENDIMTVALKLQNKYKKAQRSMCGNYKNQAVTQVHSVVKMGEQNKKFKMQMYLFDLVNMAKEGMSALPSQHLN